MFKNVWSRWKKERPVDLRPLKVDMHSHLLPTLDDGVESLEEARSILEGLGALGYEKVITTPHVMSDIYPNTPADIQRQYRQLQNYVEQNSVTPHLEVAAEYYIDEQFENWVGQEAPLLTVGTEYVLVEFSTMNPPLNLNQLIFELKLQGYTPLLAHAERYIYLFQKNRLEQLRRQGMRFQVNLLSFTRYYSTRVRKAAQSLAKAGYIDFLGTDIHRLSQLHKIQEGIRDPYLSDFLRYHSPLNRELL